MECYHCGAQLDKAQICANCGADVKIYKQIVRMSNRFYNEGLERANVRDLSGAVESLKKSLELNKVNTQARNLLGLVYFEMGETVSALREWVISKHFQPKKNPAAKFLNEVNSKSTQLDTLNQTIKKYNQALLYCRQGSYDLALIQLKKVISLNPKLVKAYQLLALLYIQNGKFEQAKKALHTAAKIDANNTTTMRYQKEANTRIRESNPKKQPKDDLISYQSGNDTIIMPAHFKDFTPVQTIINIVIGLALGIAITVFLIVPNTRQNAISAANVQLKAANDTISTKEQTISALEEQVASLQAQVDEAEGNSSNQQSVVQSYEMLMAAYSASVNGDLETAKSSLDQVVREELSTDAQPLYDAINAQVNEQYLAVTYDEGYQAYNQQDYATAIEKLNAVILIDDTYEDGNAVYYLAQAYRSSGDIESAIPYYQMMVTNYPGTRRAQTAQTYLDEYE
ncbi:MAG: tetratricopeptide repeat protein [Lachnospiraceae bacterium]